MPISIVEADYKSLKRVAKTGRVRAKDTQLIIKAIGELSPGKAKALVAERGETPQKLRARLAYSARIVGVKLRVAVDENRVLFALRGGAGAKARGGAAERKRAIQQKAVQLGKGGKKTFTANDVLKALEADGVTFGMARPATMVGAVLRNMSEFEKTARNTFRYRG